MTAQIELLRADLGSLRHAAVPKDALLRSIDREIAACERQGVSPLYWKAVKRVVERVDGEPNLSTPKHRGMC